MRWSNDVGQDATLKVVWCPNSDIEFVDLGAEPGCLKFLTKVGDEHDVSSTIHSLAFLDIFALFHFLAGVCRY